MNRSHRVAFVGALAVLLVAGCTDRVEPASVASPEPSEAPAAELTSPRPALRLTCEELFPLEELQALLVTPVEVRGDETSAPLGVRAAALAQVGATTCVYGGEDRTEALHGVWYEGTYNQGLELQVIPDGAASFHPAFVDMTASPRMNTFGDQSMLNCEGSNAGMSGSFRCQAALMVGDYLVTARLNDSAELTSGDAGKLMIGIMTTIADRIAEAGPERPLWVPPASAAADVLCQDAASGAALAGGELSGLLAYGYIGVAPGENRCTRAGASQAVDILTLEGGAWAFDDIAASPDLIFHPWLLPGSRYDVPGTDGAIITCVQHCVALVSWRGTLVQLTFIVPLLDPDVAAERLGAWAAALPAD